jgi:hypothetical protein
VQQVTRCALDGGLRSGPCGIGTTFFFFLGALGADKKIIFLFLVVPRTPQTVDSSKEKSPDTQKVWPLDCVRIG